MQATSFFAAAYPNAVSWGVGLLKVGLPTAPIRVSILADLIQSQMADGMMAKIIEATGKKKTI